MKVTLYEALGIAPNAAPEQVRAALRSIVRQYYSRTREEQVEIEEALRFINHASHILNDPARRVRYDQEIATGVHIHDGVARRDYVATMNALGVGRTISRMKRPPDSIPEISLQLGGGVALQEGQQFGLVASPARVGSNMPLQVGFGLCLIPLLLLLLWLVTPPDGWMYQVKVLLVWTTILLVIASSIYALVRFFTPRPKIGAPAPPPALAHVTIAKWRREKTVFLGTNEPVEDQTWLFRLRMAELERAKNHRTSQGHPWLRLWARSFDYGLWGLILYGLLSVLAGQDRLAETWAATLIHPLWAPILIAATWMPIEIILQTFLQTTPGKWLFAIYVQYGVSSVYAPDDWFARLQSCARRALLVWWRGLGCGVPILSLALMSVSKEMLVKKQETPWDASEDCLVTQGNIGPVNAITAMLSMLAFVWLYGNAWAEPLRATTAAAEPLIEQGSQWWHGVHLPLPGVGRRTDLIPVDVANDENASQGPTPLEVKRKRWLELERRAEKLAAAKDWQGQLRVCQPWADENYQNAAAWRCLGLAHQALGQHKLAVESLQKAAKLDPENVQVQEALIKSFRAQYQH